MPRITLTGLALVLAALFGMVQFGAPAAFAVPTTSTQQRKTKAKITHQKYRIRTLPGLTGPSQNASRQKAKKQAKEVEKAAVQDQAFIGTITKKNGHYVLTAGFFTFKLNDQAQAKKFAGKKVNVTGKLNPYKNKINVQNIQAASA